MFFFVGTRERTRPINHGSGRLKQKRLLPCGQRVSVTLLLLHVTLLAGEAVDTREGPPVKHSIKRSLSGKITILSYVPLSEVELSLVPRRFPRLLARDRRCGHARFICMAREVVGLRSMALAHARVIRHTGDLPTKHRSGRPTSRTILPSVSECLFFTFLALPRRKPARGVDVVFGTRRSINKSRSSRSMLLGHAYVSMARDRDGWHAIDVVVIGTRGFYEVLHAKPLATRFDWCWHSELHYQS